MMIIATITLVTATRSFKAKTAKPTPAVTALHPHQQTFATTIKVVALGPMRSLSVFGKIANGRIAIAHRDPETSRHAPHRWQLIPDSFHVGRVGGDGRLGPLADPRKQMNRLISVSQASACLL
jgi:hypothetical protein